MPLFGNHAAVLPLPIPAWIGSAAVVYSAVMERPEADQAAAVDRADVAAALKGDGDAYQRIVRRHQSAIAAQMWRFSRDPVAHETLVHDVFVQAWLSLRTWRAEAPFVHWLRRIAVRTGYAFWRQRDRRRDQAAEDLGELAARYRAADDFTAPVDAADLVHAVLDRLPPRDRLVLTLQYLEERGVAEIAELTGWSAAMVKVQAWRARGKFKKLMDELSGEGDAHERA